MSAFKAGFHKGPSTGFIAWISAISRARRSPAAHHHNCEERSDEANDEGRRSKTCHVRHCEPQAKQSTPPDRMLESRAPAALEE